MSADKRRQGTRIMIWFTSDTHLGHENIIRLCNRPFASAQEMDAAIIGNINAVVQPEDTLYILGDFAHRCGRDEIAAYRDRIACRNVRLVLGNHDSCPDVFGKVEPYVELRPKQYADVLMKGMPRKDLPMLVLMHYPIVEWNGFYHNSIHLHGHIHADHLYNVRCRDAHLRRYDVGVDANDFKPVSFDEIMRWFDGVNHAERADMEYVPTK